MGVRTGTEGAAGAIVSRWRRLVSLPVSLALHAAGLLLVILVLPSGTVRPPIILDLTMGSEQAASPAAPRPPPGSPSARPSPGRSGIQRVPSLPVPVLTPDAQLPPPAAVLPGESAVLPAPSAVPPQSERPPAPPRSLAAAHAVAVEHGEQVGRYGGGTAGPERVQTPGSLEAGVAGFGEEPRAGGGRERSGGGTRQDGDQRLALAVPGAGPGGPPAEYGPYLARLRQRIQEALEYPPAARRRGLTGTVHVEIVIRPDGAVGQVSVLHSSSHRILDEAALDAVRRLPPLPFPAELPPRTLRVRLPVVFELW